MRTPVQVQTIRSAKWRQESRWLSTTRDRVILRGELNRSEPKVNNIPGGSILPCLKHNNYESFISRTKLNRASIRRPSILQSFHLRSPSTSTNTIQSSMRYEQTWTKLICPRRTPSMTRQLSTYPQNRDGPQESDTVCHFKVALQRSRLSS
jgi:hypothetical protein